MNEITSKDNALYDSIREILLSARHRVYAAANAEMVQAYWNIGRCIVEYEQAGNVRAEYGKAVMQNLSKRLTAEFGKGFTIANLRNMRQFYLMFQKRYAVRSELTWTHYRMIMRIENPDARAYYIDECAKGNWSTRQLERQINSFCYERVLSSRNKEAVVAEVLRKEPISRVVATIFCNVYHMVHQNYQHCFEERFQLVLNNR